MDTVVSCRHTPWHYHLFILKSCRSSTPCKKIICRKSLALCEQNNAATINVKSQVRTNLSKNKQQWPSTLAPSTMDVFYSIPVVTRTYLVLIVATTLAVHMNVVAAYHLFFDTSFVFKLGQVHRLLTSFLYFGPPGIDLLFHLFFLAQNSRSLEETSFRGRTPEYAFFLFLACFSLLLTAPVLTPSVRFLSSPLTFILVYLYSRRNPRVRLALFGLFTFPAPFLPWVLLAFNFLMSGSWPSGNLLGMGLAHIYYFFEDVYPRIQREQGVVNPWRPLATPAFVYALFNLAAPAVPAPVAATPAVTQPQPLQNNQQLPPQDVLSDDSDIESLPNPGGYAWANPQLPKASPSTTTASSSSSSSTLTSTSIPSHTHSTGNSMTANTAAASRRRLPDTVDQDDD